jgi:hypothetical protein
MLTMSDVMANPVRNMKHPAIDPPEQQGSLGAQANYPQVFGGSHLKCIFSSIHSSSSSSSGRS